MQADPLQQLKDIHVPAPPGWWPPAPGWWLLLGLTFLAIGALCYWWRKRQQARAPLVEAQAIYQDQHRAFLAGDIDDVAYVNGTNALLKRVLIFTQHQAAAIPASGEQWLQLLDDASGSTDFTQGAGAVLGNARFAPRVELDADPFHQSISRLLGQLQHD